MAAGAKPFNGERVRYDDRHTDMPAILTCHGPIKDGTPYPRID